MAMLKMEFSRSYKSLLIWSVSVGLSMVLIIVLYPLVKDIFNSIPEESLVILEVFGGIPKDVLEYFVIEGAMWLQLVGTIYAAIYGFSLLKKEEREMTFDIIYSLPISRNKAYWTKALILFVNIMIFSLLTTFLTFVGIVIIDQNVNYRLFFSFQSLSVVLMVMIGFLSFSFAAFFKKILSSSFSLIIPLPFYVITFVSQLTKNKVLYDLRYISPFSFVIPKEIVIEQISPSLSFILIYSIITLTLLFLGSISFKKKEFFQ